MKFLSICLLAAFAFAADEKNYQQALALIDGRNYQEALAKLQAEIQGRTERADAALYWRAYSLSKLGELAAAEESLAELSAKFGTSSWRRDAAALQLEIQQARGQKVSPETQTDENLKLMAIQGLLAADPERSVPLLEKLLNDPAKSIKLKEKALFVLTQTDNAKAREVTARIAKGNANPELRKVAIRNLGFGGKRNGALLEEVYRSSSDVALKKDVLHSFMVSGDRDRLFELAKSEKDPSLRASAIQWLGVAGGRDQLVQLYGSESSAAVKKDILHGLMVSGGKEQLLALAKAEKEESLRGQAVQSMGIAGGRAELVQLYHSEANGKIKRAALHGLFLAGSAKELVAIARAEKDPGLKSEAVRKLSLMRAKEATELFEEILK